MSCPFPLERVLRRLLLPGALLAAAASAVAAPPALPAFTASTWRELQQSPQRPLLVLFSSIDCVHCPTAIDSLSAALGESRARTRLVVVVMDGAGEEEALRANPHYRRAQRLHVFAGDAMALRHQIDPGWRGITPYVAMIPAAGAVHFHAGVPAAETVRDFMRRQEDAP